MATLMTRCVTLVLLVIPLLVTVNCRPQADEDDFIYGYAEDNDVNPQLQRREPFSDDVNKVLALLTNLRSYHRLRKHLSDVIPGSSDVVKVPVELRKRQPRATGTLCRVTDDVIACEGGDWLISEQSETPVEVKNRSGLDVKKSVCVCETNKDNA